MAYPRDHLLAVFHPASARRDLAFRLSTTDLSVAWDALAIVVSLLSCGVLLSLVVREWGHPAHTSTGQLSRTVAPPPPHGPHAPTSPGAKSDLLLATHPVASAAHAVEDRRLHVLVRCTVQPLARGDVPLARSSLSDASWFLVRAQLNRGALGSQAGKTLSSYGVPHS